MISFKASLTIISILVSGALGYYIGYSPVPQLRADITSVENVNLNLQTQVSSLEDENQELLTRLEALQNDFNITTHELEELSIEYNLTQLNYVNSLSRLESLLRYYYNALLEYSGDLIEPEDDMVVTKIPGIINGDWENGNEGWLTQGVSNLVGGVKYLHENDHGTFTTQSVNLSKRSQGLQFNLKPQPFGGEIGFQVSVGDVVVYQEQFKGANSNYDWVEIVIPLRPLMIMREKYGFPIESIYAIRFTVLAGENTGSNIALDEVSLVEIEYIPK